MANYENKTRAFCELDFVPEQHESVAQRTKHFREFISTLSDSEAQIQASRCMDCGIPFCQHRCPLHNDMPDFNRLVKQGRWREAYQCLSASNDFPEITGRICPALCQESCCLGLYQNKEVGIKSIERKIIEYAYAHGWVQSFAPLVTNGKKVAVVGSGPAALSCALNLRRLGFAVCIIEKMDKLGGLLRYGIPDFKLSKEVLDRKIKQMLQTGISAMTSTLVVGSKAQAQALQAQLKQKRQELKSQEPQSTMQDSSTRVGSMKAGSQVLEQGIHSDYQQVISLEELKEQYDAVVLAVGSETPRELNLPHRNLKGIYFALDFLIAQNKENQGQCLNPIEVKGKNVVVIGGGETASDCIGVAIRKGAKSVTQLDYHEELPESVKVRDVWPNARKIKHTSTSQEEGCVRLFATNTTDFSAKSKDSQEVASVHTVQVKWGPNRKITPIKDTEKQIAADVVLIAMGYSHPSALAFAGLELEKDERLNFKASTSGDKAYLSSDPKIFVAGDCRRGQSLVVYALAEGRECAFSVNQHLCAPNFKLS